MEYEDYYQQTLEVQVLGFTKKNIHNLYDMRLFALIFEDHERIIILHPITQFMLNLSLVNATILLSALEGIPSELNTPNMSEYRVEGVIKQEEDPNANEYVQSSIRTRHEYIAGGELDKVWLFDKRNNHWCFPGWMTDEVNQVLYDLLRKHGKLQITPA